MATAPRPGAGDRLEAERSVVTLKVDHLEYHFYPAEVSARQASTVRKATGMSLQSLLASAAKEADIDTIGVLVWVARAQAGEDVDIDEVLAEITYGSDLGMAEDEAPEPDGSPEA